MLGAATVAFLMVAQQVAGKAARDGFFLETHSLTALPRVMTAAAALGLGFMLASSWLLGWLGPRRATPLLFSANAAAFLGEAWLAGRDPATAAAAMYLHTASFASIVASAFWSNMNERFDPHAAKPAFGTINVGATAGGVAGGLLAWQAVSLVSMTGILVGLAATSAACAVALLSLSPPRPISPASMLALPAAGAAPGRLFGQRYLVHLAGLVVLVQAADTLVEFVFKAEASRRFGPTGELLPFFAIFYAATSIATFGLQVGLSRRLMERLGLSGTAALLPLTTLGGAALALVAPGFWSAMAMRTGTLTAENSLFRPAYELAYTPLPPASKRRLKAYIDVGLARLAVVAAGGLTILLVGLLRPEHLARAVLVAVLLAAAASLYLSRALKEGYRQALEDSLRSGTVALSLNEIVDADTRHSYGGALVLDRQAILAQVKNLEAEEKRRRTPAGSPIVTTGPVHHGDPEAEAEDPAPFATIRRRLHGGRPEVVRTGLAAVAALPVLPGPLVGDLVPLLAVEPVWPEVLALLRGVADRHAGALSDALLDPDLPAAARRRLPRVLQAAAGHRAAAGLTDALADARFELRMLAGAALLQLHLRNPELPMDGERVLAAVRREVGADDARLGRPDPSDVDWLRDKALFAPASEPGQREATGGWWLIHVFNLLALLYDPDVLRLAFAALASADRRLRGTGLEYLEVVLPADLGAHLVGAISKEASEKRPARAQRVVAEDLLASRDSLAISSDALARLRSGKPP